MLLFVWNRSSEMSVIRNIRHIFSRAERTYGGRINGPIDMVVSMLFRLGVVALATYLAVYKTGDFTIINYMKIAGVAACVFVVQALSAACVGHVFLPSKQAAIATEQYNSIRNLACILLWPILLLAVNIPSKMTLYVLCGILFAGFTCVALGKGVQLFYKNALTPLYIVLYFTSLEVVPMAGILLLAKHII